MAQEFGPSGGIRSAPRQGGNSFLRRPPGEAKGEKEGSWALGCAVEKGSLKIKPKEICKE